MTPKRTEANVTVRAWPSSSTSKGHTSKCSSLAGIVSGRYDAGHACRSTTSPPCTSMIAPSPCRHCADGSRDRGSRADSRLACLRRKAAVASCGACTGRRACSSSIWNTSGGSASCSKSPIRPARPRGSRPRCPAPEGASDRSDRVTDRVTDKRLTEEDVVAELRDGMTIGIGGWGSRRKPMSIVRAILRSDLKDLTIVSYGGPDVGMLCAAAKAKKVIYGFVSLDTIPLEPHFRAARQNGTIEAMELDEGMLQLGLRAAAWRVSFLPCRAGLGSAIMEINPPIKTVTSPYDGEELVAMPALPLDVALLHANRADARGDAQYLGPDWYFDDLFAMAAERTFVSCEKVIDADGFAREGPPESIRISRMWTTGVVEAPFGAHFTHCVPDYPRDEALQREYAATAKEADAWQAFRNKWIDVPEADYRHNAETSLNGASA